jgi:hypothetical protein
MPRRDAKPSTGIWLSDALTLFIKYYKARQLAERKLVAAKMSGCVGWDCQEYEGRLGNRVGHPLFWRWFWRPRHSLRSLTCDDSSAEFFTKNGRNALWGIWLVRADLLAWLQEDGVTLLSEDLPAPKPEESEKAAEREKPAPRASRPRRRGKQIDRVYRELRVKFPPDGKVPPLMTIDAIRAKLLPGWQTENKEQNLVDPSTDVVAAAVKVIGRRAD